MNEETWKGGSCEERKKITTKRGGGGSIAGLRKMPTPRERKTFVLWCPGGCSEQFPQEDRVPGAQGHLRGTQRL